jgi:GR25 family glycosyltransferase involved in LPS biosynthesis
MVSVDLPVYVINLNKERGRWENCLRQQKKLGLNLNRVSAIEIGNLSAGEATFVSAGVRAVWLSHMKCFEIFLTTHATHALILEDDFEIEKVEQLKSFLHSASVLEHDLVQFGFLKPGPDTAIRVATANLETTLFRLMARIANMKILRGNNIANRLRVQEARDMPKGFTADDFQPGAHCYLVSRRLAGSVLQMNNPQFLSIDDFFTALSQMRTFRSIRIKKSIVSQAPFPKWQGERFLKI